MVCLSDGDVEVTCLEMQVDSLNCIHDGDAALTCHGVDIGCDDCVCTAGVDSV